MAEHLKHIETILYVSNQDISRDFYEKLLRKPPDLDVPGMTEFILTDTFKLGLMPNNGIAKIIGEKLPHPDKGLGIPRCELYLRINDVRLEFDNAVKTGAKLISAIADRDWGDTVCYFADPDGHVIAFAERKT